MHTLSPAFAIFHKEHAIEINRNILNHYVDLKKKIILNHISCSCTMSNDLPRIALLMLSFFRLYNDLSSFINLGVKCVHLCRFVNKQ